MTEAAAEPLRVHHRELSAAEEVDVSAIMLAATALMNAISGAGLDRTREGALARTKVEEAVMWAVKGVTG